MKISATMARSIQTSTVRRNAWIMMEMPTVIAMAAMSAATITALRYRLRRRFCAASRNSSTAESNCGDAEPDAASRRPSSARRNARSTSHEPAWVSAGAVKAKPSRIKNALPNPSHAGPVVSASTEQTMAMPSDRKPAASQRGVWRRLFSCVEPSPRLNAETGSARAPSHAGSHAAASTEPRPEKERAAQQQRRQRITIHADEHVERADDLGDFPA